MGKWARLGSKQCLKDRNKAQHRSVAKEVRSSKVRRTRHSARERGGLRGTAAACCLSLLPYCQKSGHIAPPLNRSPSSRPHLPYHLSFNPISALSPKSLRAILISPVSTIFYISLHHVFEPSLHRGSRRGPETSRARCSQVHLLRRHQHKCSSAKPSTLFPADTPRSAGQRCR